ncbi:hypothetical protein BGZ94_000327, partial [Podila epigama]
MASIDSLPGLEAVCQAFHPVENDESLSVLSFKVPAAIQPPKKDLFEDETPLPPVKTKEAFFHICLDVSGSMAGSGIRCAKIAMGQLIDHLEKSGVPPTRITVYTYQNTCTIRHWGQDPQNDRQWLENARAGG